MSELSESSVPPTLQKLRESHLADAPTPLQRERLMQQIYMANSGVAASAKADQRRLLRQLHTRWIWVSGAVVCAAAISVVLTARRLSPPEPAPTLHPETSMAWNRASEGSSATTSFVAPSVALASNPGLHAFAPCVRGQGNDGALSVFNHKLRTSAQPLTGAPHSAIEASVLPIPELDGRSGEWFHWRSTSDAESRRAPLEVLRAAKGSAAGLGLKIAGPPPVGWGANAGVRFHHCYDASAYEGVRLRMHGTGAVFVHFQTLDTVPVELGGRCTDRCWVAGGRVLVLTRRPQTQVVRFSDVSRDYPRGVVATELLQIMFSVQSGADPYEFWLDEMEFIPKH